jgi:hypothetical protein
MTATIENQSRAAVIAADIARLLRPLQRVELRALHLPNARALSRAFDATPEGIMSLASQALAWEAAGARGIYWTPNPLRPDFADGASARDADVLERRWLLVDVDPVRPADCPSTDGERRAAWDVACCVLMALRADGWSDPAVAHSGNGWHLLYPVELANDEAAKALCKGLLHGLHERLSTERAKVDVTTYNAARIVRLYGTVARKGTPTADRPHRRSRLVEVPT